jgi:hypothetical protein
MNRRITSWVLLFLLLLFFAPLVLAQGYTIDNGSFHTGLEGWLNNGQWSWANSGYDANSGSARTTDYMAWIISDAFTAGANSSLTWAEKTDSGACTMRVWLLNYNTNSRINYGDFAVTSTWQQFTYDLSNYAGKTLSVMFELQTWGCSTNLDAVSVSNIAAPAVLYSGDFPSSPYGWVEWGGNGTFSTQFGHNAVGSIDAPGYGGGNYLCVPFTLRQSAWQVYYYNNGQFRLDILDMTAGTRTTLRNTYQGQNGVWSLDSFALNPYLHHKVRFFGFFEGTGAGSLFVDELCPTEGCDKWTYTPTPTATSAGGFPYSYGTPVPIDWSQFPTQVPFPTFPPYPTQIPFPTPIYGPGTPQPITGTVKIDDTTPVAVKIDDRTPVRVSIGPDPNYTPQVPGNWSGSVSSSAPKPGMGIPTLISSPAQSTIEYGQAGSATNPINFHIAQEDWVTPCLNFNPFGIPCLTMTIHYLYPDQFNLVGIDILPGLYSLAAAFFLVFLLRQLQAR